MWIARDESGAVYLYKYKPIRLTRHFVSYNGERDEDNIYLGEKEVYPELTWGNSPQEVKITLPTTGLDRGRKDSIIRGLKKLEKDYMLSYTEEIDWLNKLVN